ncbi:MAG: glycoside hydrolase family 16 protein [Terriglobales bacterium]
MIKDDGRWAGSTQVASDYAALLVEPGYNPPELTESLPAVGPGVAASAIVNDRGAPAVFPAARTLNFSGYEWAVTSGPIYRAGSLNSFDPANVWVDAGGALHLRVSGSEGKWSAAEVKLTRSLGYGTYRFRVRDISHLEPSAVLTLVSWDGVGTEQNRRELDVELSRWGYIHNDNAHYVVQPYYLAANIVRFRVPAGVFTHSFHWEPGQVTFSTAAGSGGAGTPAIKQHVFTSGVPAAGNETVRISLYVFHRAEVPLKSQSEVVIEKFEYLP